MPDEEGKFIVTKEWFELSEQRRKEFDAKYEKLHDRITTEYDKLRNELYSDIEREMKEVKDIVAHAKDIKILIKEVRKKAIVENITI